MGDQIFFFITLRNFLFLFYLQGEFLLTYGEPPMLTKEIKDGREAPLKPSMYVQ